MSTTTTGERRLFVAAALDTAVVVAFVAIGRRNHEEDPALTGLLFTLAPFLIGLAVGWVAARAWQRPWALVTGASVWAATIGIGMLLRRFAFDRGTALSFVIVATLFTGVFLLGWRLLAPRVTRR